MDLDNGQRSMEAWYFIFSICFFNASRSMFCRALGSMAARIYPHATPAKTESVRESLRERNIEVVCVHVRPERAKQARCRSPAICCVC